jgi:hypothetical protein
MPSALVIEMETDWKIEMLIRFPSLAMAPPVGSPHVPELGPVPILKGAALSTVYK